MTTSYLALPAALIDFIREHPDVLELSSSLSGRVGRQARPVSHDLAALLRDAEAEPAVLGDYGRLSLATLRSLVGSPHVRVVDKLTPYLDIDKAGPAIHWLMTGTLGWQPHPGGIELACARGEVAPRLFRPDQVRELASAALELDVLRDRFDPGRMTELDVYPRIWHDADALDYVLLHYARLVEYLRHAADRAEGLAICASL